MAKLNDTQMILLSTAAQRDSGSVFPLSGKLSPSPRIDKAIDGLLAAALIEDRQTNVGSEVCRTDGNIRFGRFITPTGLAAIGLEADERTQADGCAPAPAPTPGGTNRVTKASAVIALLQRDGGATLAELIAATDWLPHTTRAALTGLRKKGHAVERSKRGDDTCYSIEAAT